PPTPLQHRRRSLAAVSPLQRPTAAVVVVAAPDDARSASRALHGACVGGEVAVLPRPVLVTVLGDSCRDVFLVRVRLPRDHAVGLAVVQQEGGRHLLALLLEIVMADNVVLAAAACRDR